MKVCFRCKIEKDLSCFGNDKNTKSGLKSNCKECINAGHRKERREGKPQKIIKGSYLWHLKKAGMFDYYKNYIKQ